MTMLKFTQKKYVATEPLATISRDNSIHLNAKCVEEFLDNCKYVELLYDSDKKVVGIQPVKKSTTYSFSARRSKSRRRKEGFEKGVAISATSFLKYFKIVHEKSKRYPTTWNDKGRYIEVRLK